MSIPKISIIIPVYNVEKYLKDCLTSVLNQTFKDFEVICVNDGSTDNSLIILQDFAKKDIRIKVINQKNQGPSAARNAAMKIAKGKYISFIDSDDWVDNNYFEKLYNTILKNNADIAVSNLIRKHNSYEKYRMHYKKEEIYTSLSDKIKVCNIPNSCYACGKLYKSSIIKNNIFIEGVYFEDMMWLPKIIKKSKKLITVTNINYYYRVNKNSIVKKSPSKKKQNDLYIARQYIVDFFKENKLVLPKNYENITKRKIDFLGITILKIKEKNNIKTYYLFGIIPFFKY